jgi:hypothetical protein
LRCTFACFGWFVEAGFAELAFKEVVVASAVFVAFITEPDLLVLLCDCCDPPCPCASEAFGATDVWLTFGVDWTFAAGWTFEDRAEA